MFDHNHIKLANTRGGISQPITNLDVALIIIIMIKLALEVS